MSARVSSVSVTSPLLFSYCVFFFFLMIRRPPRSTLFPYTDALPISSLAISIAWTPRGRGNSGACMAGTEERSEEHTSELQSRQYLVCRLLLEKKKKMPDGSRAVVPVWMLDRAACATLSAGTPLTYLT